VKVTVNFNLCDQNAGLAIQGFKELRTALTDDLRT